MVRRTGISPDQAAALAEIAQTTRAKSSITEAISTRELLAVAYDLKHFGEQSLRYTMLSKVEDPAQRTSLATLLAGKFPGIMANGTAPASIKKDPF